jgi:thioredoxin-related protein
MFKFLISITLITTIVLGQTSDDFFNTTADDLQEVLDEANSAHKKGILIFFGMKTCPFCHKMKMNILNNNEIIKFYEKNFLMLELDITSNIEMIDFKGKDTTFKDFANKHRVRATPVIAFFNLKGKKIFKRTGYMKLEEFKLLGDFIVQNLYLTQRFTKYKRKILKK